MPLQEFIRALLIVVQQLRIPLKEKNTIKEIYSEIVKAEDVVKYHDRNGYLRRVEQLYNKGPTLRKVNQKIF